MRPSNEASQIIDTHQARLFWQELLSESLRAGLWGLYRALTTARITIEDKRTIQLKCRFKEDLKALRGQYTLLASKAQKYDFSRILLDCSASKKPYVIETKMALEDGIPSRRIDDSVLAVLQIGELIGSSELPMALIDLDFDDQIWANEALANLKGKTMEYVRSENVRRLWNPQALDLIKSTVKRDGILDNHLFTADINPGQPCKLQNRFQLELGHYRLTTILECEFLGATV